jgi:pimeloyl-ACP methyl ester carboxylesterase
VVEERSIDVDGVRVFYRQVEGEGPPVVFVHGNPTHSGDWVPFLERMPGPAIAPDLPGWGRSDRPGGFDYSMHGLAGFFEGFLRAMGIEEYALVVHDWGSLALITAQREPSRVSRLVVSNAVPLLPGYRWHWIARYFWRVPVAGELLNLAATRSATALVMRQARGDRSAMPKEFIDMIWEGAPRGTRRPVLELYRSADPGELAAAGVRLGELRCPALVLWGEADPFLDSRFGRAYAERLPEAQYAGVAGAGHWPWIDRPEVIPRVLNFLASG